MEKSQVKEMWRDHCEQIVKIFNAWADVEISFHVLLASVLKIKMSYAIGLLSTVAGNKVQRDMIMNAAMVALPSQQPRKKIETLLKRFGKAARKRNQIAHGRIFMHPTGMGRLAVMTVRSDLMPAQFGYDLFTRADLLRMENEFRSLAGDAQQLAASLRRTKRRPLPEVWPRPTRLP